MNEDTVKKWIRKAESDLKIGRDELLVQESATDAVCFHAQQCVEKYLKAFLVFNGKEISKTHDILRLVNECIAIDKEFRELVEWDAIDLTDYAVEIRYPDEFYFPSIEEAKEAIEVAVRVKEFMHNKLEARA